jgi:hypothetical protein
VKEFLILTIVAALSMVLAIVLERWMGLHPGRGTLNLSCGLGRSEKTTPDKTAPASEEKKD